MSVYVKNGKVLSEKPSDGTYAGVVKLPICKAQLLQFFSVCLDYYRFARKIVSDDVSLLSFEAHRVIDIFDNIAEEAEVKELFESFVDQSKEIVYGEES